MPEATMKPRQFVLSRDSGLRNCAYTVIPVRDNRLLDLPYHVHRIQESFALLSLSGPVQTNSNPSLISARSSSQSSSPSTLTPRNARGLEDCGELIAASCIKSILSSDFKDGLLTVCIGSGKEDTSSFESDVLYYEMPPDFLTASKMDVVVDLQRYSRMTDPRIKASSWPAERQKLETARHPTATETIIYRTLDTSKPNESVINSVPQIDGGVDTSFESLHRDEVMSLTEGIFTH